MIQRIIHYLKPKSKTDKVFEDMYTQGYTYGTIYYNIQGYLEITFTTGINGRGNVKQIKLGNYGK
jgi:hypothetical protein